MTCIDGAILRNVAAGGANAEKTSIYKVESNDWVPGPDMATPRGYHSQTTMENGEVQFNFI